MTPAPQPAARFRFGVFEVDTASGELRKRGMRIKLHVQPFQVLVMLLTHPGEVLTREQIARELWPEGTFVDYEHGVNSAINRVREALDDSARSPRFLETLHRRGYRFLAPVEQITASVPKEALPDEAESSASAPLPEMADPALKSRLLVGPHDLPVIPHRTAQMLFLALQVMYLAFYVGALANLGEIEGMFSVLDHPTAVLLLLIVTAALLIPVRIYLLTAVLFRPPGLHARYNRLWPFLLPFDVLWSLAPFLLLHHINAGLALACMAPLVYSPFAQRALILMGAGTTQKPVDLI